MTQQEAEARLMEVIRPTKLFKYNEIPSNYVETKTQPTIVGFEDYKQCRPVYSQAEKDEILMLNAIINEL